ncbi:hypothetical protein [Cohnella terricola]|uniref:Uncharacterized protein n=1 Tax=Cohnella terricola TaxID=1289167 RepID=A0A559JU03_9BACL|nr:hypothetical protein [Cohnella terricola]TVY03364.1 hypothetical protein FPZ45_04530 [Cohnella terricola]
MPFDELLKELQGQKTAQVDPDHIPLEQLFDETFMKKHSQLNSFSEFLAKGNFQIETQEDIRNIPDELLERHVARETEFANWNEMLQAASSEFGSKDKKADS